MKAEDPLELLMRESKLKKSRFNVPTNKEKKQPRKTLSTCVHAQINMYTYIHTKLQDKHDSLVEFKTQKQYKQDFIKNIKNSECKIWPLRQSLI